MSLADSSDGPIFLPVTHLLAAQTFYLAALQPLGYTIVDGGQYNHSNGRIAFGPAGTNRVDLLLSGSSRRASQSAGGRQHTINFPATSKVAVQEFYNAVANQAGVTIIEAPLDGPNGFAAIVKDLDGNNVQVIFRDNQLLVHEGVTTASDLSMTVSEAMPIEAWRDRVASTRSASRYTPASYVPPAYAPINYPTSGDLPTTTPHAVAPRPPRTQSTIRTRRDRSPTPSSESAKSTKSNGFDARIALGAAAIVTAAGVVAHLFNKQAESKEEKHRKWKKEQNRRLKLEEAQQGKGVATVETETRPDLRRGDKTATGRDSGFYSTRTIETMQHYKQGTRPRRATFSQAQRETSPSFAALSKTKSARDTPTREWRRDSSRGAAERYISTSQTPSIPFRHSRPSAPSAPVLPTSYRTRKIETWPTLPPQKLDNSKRD